MSVHDDAGIDIESIAENDVGGFSSDTPRVINWSMLRGTSPE